MDSLSLLTLFRGFNKFIGMLFQYAARLYEKLFSKKFVFGLGWDSFKLPLRST
jgi:hypothetical protein